MIRALAVFALLLGASLLAGCQSTASTPPPYAPMIARFYLETRPDEIGVPVTLPQSGITLTVAAKPVLVEYDVVNAEIVQVELGRCLMVQLSPAAARDLYRLSVSAIGRRLVLSLNDQVLGARRIENAMADGVVLVFVEMPDEQLPSIVERIKRTSADLAEAAQKARKS